MNRRQKRKHIDRMVNGAVIVGYGLILAGFLILSPIWGPFAIAAYIVGYLAERYGGGDYIHA